jgi:uncharacterized protein (DUF2062 family)
MQASVTTNDPIKDSAPSLAGNTADAKAKHRRRTRFKRLDRYRHMPWWVRKLHHWLPRPDKYENTTIHRWLGSSIFRKECWELKPMFIARGVATGVLVSWTPTMPFQLVLTVIFCVLFRGNIPLGLLATWISNPITFLPIFAGNLYVGCWLLGIPFPLGMINELMEAQSWSVAMNQILQSFLVPLWVGSLAVGIPVTVLAFFLSHGMATRLRRKHLLASIKERTEKRILRAIQVRENMLIRRQEKIEEKLADKRAKYAEKRVKLAEKRARIEDDIRSSNPELIEPRSTDPLIRSTDPTIDKPE